MDNVADKLRAAQKARNYERQARESGLRKDWIEAAKAWKLAGNNDRYEECKLAAEMSKR